MKAIALSAASAAIIHGVVDSRTLLPEHGDVLLPSQGNCIAVDDFIKNRKMLYDPVDRMSKQLGDHLHRMVAHYKTFGTESPAYRRMLAVSRTIQAVRSVPTPREMDRLLADYNR